MSVVVVAGVLNLAAPVALALARVVEAKQNAINQELINKVAEENQQAKERTLRDEAIFSESLASVLDKVASVQQTIVTNINAWWPIFNTQWMELQRELSSTLTASSLQLLSEMLSPVITDVVVCERWVARLLNHRGHSQLAMASRHFLFRRALNRLQSAVDQSESIGKSFPSLANIMTSMFQIPQIQLRDFHHFTRLDSPLEYPSNPDAYNLAIRDVVTFAVDTSPEPPLMQARYDFVCDWLHFGCEANATPFTTGCLILESVPIGNSPTVKQYAILKSQRCRLLNGTNVQFRGPLIVLAILGERCIVQFVSGHSDSRHVADWIRGDEFDSCCVLGVLELQRKLEAAKYHFFVEAQKGTWAAFLFSIPAHVIECKAEWVELSIEDSSFGWVTRTRFVVNWDFGSNLGFLLPLAESNEKSLWKVTAVGPARLMFTNKHYSSLVIYCKSNGALQVREKGTLSDHDCGIEVMFK
jgi:hypothetical protein